MPDKKEKSAVGIGVPATEDKKTSNESIYEAEEKIKIVISDFSEAEAEYKRLKQKKEQLEKEWKELEPWNNVGPTVREFLYGKQHNLLSVFSRKERTCRIRRRCRSRELRAPQAL